jgi:hypothetical protein
MLCVQGTKFTKSLVVLDSAVDVPLTHREGHVPINSIHTDANSTNATTAANRDRQGHLGGYIIVRPCSPCSLRASFFCPCSHTPHTITSLTMLLLLLPLQVRQNVSRVCRAETSQSCLAVKPADACVEDLLAATAAVATAAGAPTTATGSTAALAAAIAAPIFVVLGMHNFSVIPLPAHPATLDANTTPRTLHLCCSPCSDLDLDVAASS